MTRALLAIIVAFLTLAPAPVALAQYPFTYQGELQSGASVYTGSADFRITVFDSATGGTLVAGPRLLSSATVDAQGRFTISPDFGTPLTTTAGSALYLLIEARTPTDPTNTLPFTPLSPRQRLTPTPLATFSTLAETASIANSALTLDNQPASFYRNASNLNAGVISSTLLSSSVLQLGTPNQAITGSKFFLPNTLVLRNAANTRGISFNPATLTADRTLTLPDVSGTLITTGNLSAITLAGDATGTAAAAVVSRIRGVAVSAVAPVDGQGLFFDGTQWVPQYPPLPLQVFAGDVSGTFQNTVVTAIWGFNVSPATPALNNALTWNGTQWIPQAIPQPAPLTFSSGLIQTGSAVSVQSSGIGSALLASEILSLGKITGNLLQNVAGTSIVANGNLTSTGNMIADEFVYTAPVTSFYMIPDSAFESRDGSGVSRNLTGTAAANPVPPGTSAGLTAPVHLPDGAIITGCRVFAIDNNAIFNLTTTLGFYDPAANTSGSIAILSTIGASVNLQTLSSPTLNHTVTNSTRAYRVIITSGGSNWSDSTAHIRAIRIEYTMARPAR